MPDNISRRRATNRDVGQCHLRYIKTERKALFTELLTSGRLNTYLTNINEQATEQMLLLMKQMAEREGSPSNSRHRIKCCRYNG